MFRESKKRRAAATRTKVCKYYEKKTKNERKKEK
jgi:hypothetical protein